MSRKTEGVDRMSSITIDLPLETYKRLEAQARKIGQDPATLSRELLESALQAREAVQCQTAREVLEAAGRVRPLSTTLRDRIIPTVTLDEVRMIFKHAAGPALSEIIQDQRGSKA
jgi:predicted DNA-binding protein